MASARNELIAIDTRGGWHVIDPEGGTWWPGEAAADDINSALDPAERAIEWCYDRPLAGDWHC